jgi:hypothetical protein
MSTLLRFLPLALLTLLLLACGASSPVPVATPGAFAAAASAAPASMAPLFVMDGACTSLQPIDAPETSPELAVQAILRSPALAALPLADTRVRVTESTALVELRMQVGTGRSLRDLSTCERLALLGGIRLTLQGNPHWGIHRVVFTDRGNLFAI